MTEIKTERLELKKHGTVYLHSTHVYASDPENTVYMINLPNNTIEETTQYLKLIDDEWSKPDQKLFERVNVLNANRESRSIPQYLRCYVILHKKAINNGCCFQ